MGVISDCYLFLESESLIASGYIYEELLAPKHIQRFNWSYIILLFILQGRNKLQFYGF